MEHKTLTKSHILKKTEIHPNWFNRANKRWAPLQNVGKNIHKAKIQDWAPVWFRVLCKVGEGQIKLLQRLEKHSQTKNFD